MLIVKVPALNGLGKTKGCEKAPNAIIKALEDIWTNEEEKKIEKKQLDYEEIHVDNTNIELSNKLIYKNALELFRQQDKVIFIGGDHSISFSLCKAFLDFCRNTKNNPGLIIFDAHPDCMPASKQPTHEEWLRGLLEVGFPAKNILIIGIRAADEVELHYLKSKHINYYSCKELFTDIQQTCDGIMEAARKFSQLYISFDIDTIDPAFAPGTGYIEPAGLTSREFLYFFQRLLLLGNLKAADIVEINPEKDINGITVKLGTKILAELL